MPRLRVLPVLAGLVVASAPWGTASAAPDDRKGSQAPSTSTPDATASDPEDEPRVRRRPFAPAEDEDAVDETPDRRRFMIGLQGVVFQAPPLRTTLLWVDPRFVGRSVALGGVGLFGRFRPRPIVGFDVGVRSGSLRYSDDDNDTVILQDQVMADLGVLLFLGRGKIAQLAVAGGLGGMFNRVGYDVENGPDGRQIFGSGLVYVGAEAEFLVKRVAFVLSFRSYGVFTDRDAVNDKGPIFASASSEDRLAPVPTLQTALVGAAGIAYRF